MLDKKVTRKELLMGMLSIGGILLASKIHPTVKKIASAASGKKVPAQQKDNSYGNFAYGGGKKNA